MTTTAGTTGSVSIVIPVLNAAPFLPELFAALLRQRPAPPAEIVLVDSGSTDGTAEVARQCPLARVIPVPRFTHGGSRNLGIREARGEFVVLMTQDAVPKGDDWLRQLLAPFATPDVAAAFSRQQPRSDATPMERFFLETHFPAQEMIYRLPAGRKGLLFQKDVFLSNVSAALRREIVLKYPFDETLIMSEDQQFARDVLLAGYAIVYAPSSVVTHSHNYTWSQAVRRYFDSVYSLTKIFPHHDLSASAGMGTSYLRREAAMMFRRRPFWLPRYAAYVLAKTLGTVLGHFAEQLPLWFVRRVSLHSAYWDKRD